MRTPSGSPSYIQHAGGPAWFFLRRLCDDTPEGVPAWDTPRPEQANTRAVTADELAALVATARADLTMRGISLGGAS